MMLKNQILDVTVLEPSRKHPAIFEHFDALLPEEILTIHNDHDPKPLYYQLLAERGKVFEWNYLEKGPYVWLVEIKKTAELSPGETVGEIAAADMRKAEVFRKYGIDFCCGGKKSLQEAAREKGLDPFMLRSELEDCSRKDSEPVQNYNEWDPGFLADYIVQKHHRYVSRQIPVLTELAQKTTQAHSDKHSELKDVNALLNTLLSELESHMQKEERVLFPYIKQLQACRDLGTAPEKPVFETVEMPINIMEMEHESAGELFADIRLLSRDYTIPEDACNTYRYFYTALAEFEADLNTHIHLENNILFPKSVRMEKELLNA